MILLYKLGFIIWAFPFGAGFTLKVANLVMPASCQFIMWQANASIPNALGACAQVCF